MLESQDIKKRLKLGAFILTGLILFLGTVYYLGRENSVFNRTFTLSSTFKNVEGLKEGDNVWLSGVKIGTVKKVEIISMGKVLVSFSLKDRQNKFIKQDATAIVSSDGLVGNKIVVIIPGTHPSAVQDNDTIRSESPTDTQELFNLAKDVGNTTRTITEDLRRISARLNNGEGIVGELLRDGPISKDLRQAIASLKQASQTTTNFANGAQTLMKELNQGDGLVSKLINDTAYARTFSQTMDNIEKIGESSRILSNDLQKTVAHMNDTNSAFGVLTSDSLFAHKLRGTLDHAQSASIRLDSNMQALRHNFLLRGYFKKLDKQKTAKN
jgi:phospholipid/cholesterol/gamma-HCH transport system substrate-binding protein